LSAGLETEVRELLDRLAEPEQFECCCDVARRVGWSPRQAFESLAQLWVSGQVEHVDGEWRTRTRDQGDTTT
jgi:hypothetical protein